MHAYILYSFSECLVSSGTNSLQQAPTYTIDRSVLDATIIRRSASYAANCRYINCTTVASGLFFHHSHNFSCSLFLLLKPSSFAGWETRIRRIWAASCPYFTYTTAAGGIFSTVSTTFLAVCSSFQGPPPFFSLKTTIIQNFSSAANIEQLKHDRQRSN